MISDYENKKGLDWLSVLILIWLMLLLLFVIKMILVD
jgi:hypothetical protein